MYADASTKHHDSPASPVRSLAGGPLPRIVAGVSGRVRASRRDRGDDLARGADLWPETLAICRRDEDPPPALGDGGRDQRDTDQQLAVRKASRDNPNVPLRQANDGHGDSLKNLPAVSLLV